MEILADEPTTALDVTIQAQVLKLMKDLRDQLKTSMLMITHDLGIIAETCDDVAVSDPHGFFSSSSPTGEKAVPLRIKYLLCAP